MQEEYRVAVNDEAYPQGFNDAPFLDIDDEDYVAGWETEDDDAWEDEEDLQDFIDDTEGYNG